MQQLKKGTEHFVSNPELKNVERQLLFVRLLLELTLLSNTKMLK